MLFVDINNSLIFGLGLSEDLLHASNVLNIGIIMGLSFSLYSHIRISLLFLNSKFWQSVTGTPFFPFTTLISKTEVLSDIS